MRPPRCGASTTSSAGSTTASSTRRSGRTASPTRSAALESFLDIVNLRRLQHPEMHIYHYAPYEPSHLLAMAARHGVREADVDRLLSDGVFVDLYPIVRRALRVGSRSYSIKKLEPLYMGDEVRTSDVQKGDDSIVQYVQARALADDGRQEEARAILDDLADYNRYDCVSTRRLRDWLVDRARDAGLRPTPNPEPGEAAYQPSVRRPHARFSSRREHPADSSEAQSLRLGAAAIDYYPREAKSFWATHFLRLREPVSLWEDTRDVAVLDAQRCRVIEDWHRGGGPAHRSTHARAARRARSRHPTERGLEPVRAVRAAGQRSPSSASPRWIHADASASGSSRCSTTARSSRSPPSTARRGLSCRSPSHPASPPRALNQQVAIDAWADAVIAAAPRLPADPATDILRRRPPRTRSRLRCRHPPETTSMRSCAPWPTLDHSYLAVQGPPGTGKTYVGSHVIARLVRERGFKVGVVAQSHAVVENMLDRVVAAGVPREQVAKAPKDPTARRVVHRDREERHGRVHRRARCRRIRGGRHGLGLQPRGPHPAGQSRSARDRRGRPVLARLHDRRVTRRAAAAAARRSAAAAAGEPGNPPRARRHFRARLGDGWRRRHPARVRLLPGTHVADAPRRRRARLAPVVRRRARCASCHRAARARRRRAGSASDRGAPPRQCHPIDRRGRGGGRDRPRSRGARVVRHPDRRRR